MHAIFIKLLQYNISSEAGYEIEAQRSNISDQNDMTELHNEPGYHYVMA